MEEETPFLQILRQQFPELYLKKKCEVIIESVKDYRLPDIEKYKTEIKQKIKIPTKLEFPDNNYGLALRFLQLRKIFIRLYSLNEHEEYKQILDYLKCFEYFFTDLVQPYKQKTFFTIDKKLNNATENLKPEIEHFCNKYDFIIKDEQDLMDELFGNM